MESSKPLFLLLVTLGVSAPAVYGAEIFQFFQDYDVDAFDIKSGYFNNDSLEDFAVVDYRWADSSYFEVFLSNGDCSFTRMGAVNLDTTDFGQIQVGDFNEDSLDDLLVMTLDDTWFFTSNGDGTFGFECIFEWSYCFGGSGDINNDGHLDLVGIPQEYWNFDMVGGDTIQVMLGDGKGNFSRGWSNAWWQYTDCGFAYLDSAATDTLLDIYAVDQGMYLSVFFGSGGGDFEDPFRYQIFMPGVMYYQVCTSGDFNEDEYGDISISGIAGMSNSSTCILENIKDGTFERNGYECFDGSCYLERLDCADLNLDGHLDLSLASDGGTIAGDGDGTFSDWLSTGPGADFVFMDMDHDGDLDFANRRGRIYCNTTLTGIEESPEIINDIIVSASPNPFSSYVDISVMNHLEASSTLQVFDLSGRMVQELQPQMAEGSALYHWDGTSSSGHDLPSGVYTARLSFGDDVSGVMLLKLE